MDRRYIEEHHVLTRYLAGQLSDAERETFETHYVEHPEALRELEVAAKMKLGLGLLQESGELTEHAPRSQPWLRTLAAVLLIAGIAAVFWPTAPWRTPAVMAASLSELGWLHGASQVLTDTIVIERSRSRGVDARFELPAAGQVARWRVVPEHPSQTGYALRLNAMDPPHAVAELRALRTDADGLITVFVSSKGLAPGRYALLVSAESAVGPAPAAVSSFSILIEAARNER